MGYSFWHKSNISMKPIYSLLITIIFVTMSYENTYAQKSKHDKAWYTGGTLHKSKVIEWKRATKENKLATCADFVANTRKVKDINELLMKSVELRACIDESVRDNRTLDNEGVAEVAALCTVILK